MENNPLRGLFGVSSSRAQVVRDDPPPTENISYEIPLGILERLRANPYAGDRTIHPDMQLVLMDELYGLFKLACLSNDGVKKRIFPLSLEEKALAWYGLLDNSHSWDWNQLKPEFHNKFYPMHLVHRDRNYIYNFWPREGESIAQAWGRRTDLILKCPNHELSRDIIVHNFYARLSLRDKEMLDSSSAGSFSSRQIEFKWDLIKRIKCNAEDWEVDKGKESGINLEYDRVKSFVETDDFHELSAKYGLDSAIVVNFCKPFAAHVDLPKENWFKYHEPIKDICKEPIIANTKVQSYAVNPVVPTAYIEKPPFSVRIKENSKATTVIHKSNIKAPKHSEQIKVEPSIAMVKDLLVENIDGHVIYFCEDAARIAKPIKESKDRNK